MYRRRYPSRRYSRRRYSRRRSNSLSARGVRLRRPATGRVQPLLSRARTTTLTKFWESLSLLTCHNGNISDPVAATRRNVRAFNLISLGTGVYNRLANRVRIHSMVFHLKFTWDPFLRSGDLYSATGGVMAPPGPGPQFPHIPVARVTMLLVFIRHPRIQPPAPGDILVPATSDGFERIDLDEGIRILLRKEFVLTVDACHAFSPSGGQNARILYSRGKGSDFEYDFKLPLGYVMGFEASTPTPFYANINQGALLAYFMCDYDPPGQSDIVIDYVAPTVLVRTRTAFTDV